MRVIDLGYRPRPWQQEVHAHRARFLVVVVHRRAGKTELALRRLLDSALRTTAELPTFTYIAPFLKQAKAIAWRRLRDICAPLIQHGIVDVLDSELTVQVRHNGAVLRLFGADNPDALRGVRLDGAVIDEVAQIKPELWYDVVQPALADRKGWALFIGTPYGADLFSELYMAAATRDGWGALRYTVYETQALDPDEVKRLRGELPEHVFAREFLCDFTAAADDQLISLVDVQEARRRVVRREDWVHAPVVLGVDVARFGADRSVIQPRQGLVAHAPIVMQGADTIAVASRVAQAIADVHPAAVFVDAGAGGGVIDYLRRMGHRIVEVPFGGSPLDPRYRDRRAEMWYAVREWLQAGGALPDMDAYSELTYPRYSYSPAGKIEVESKDSMKARGLRSPDVGDALALTFAAPVAVPDARSELRPEDVTRYDPISADMR